MTPAQEQAVVAEARRWLGVPYHHAADIHGYGVDCAMLAVRVYVDTGVLPPFDPRPYPPDWHLHRDDERFLGWVKKFARKVPKGRKPRPGDLAIFRFARAASHGGIIETVGEDPVMIHADRDAGAVCRCEVRRYHERLVSFWRMPA